MILNTKYHDIREIVNKKLEEFFSSLDHLENYLDLDEIQNISINNNDDVQMQDVSKIEENGKGNKNNQDQNENVENTKIYLSTSQIMTKILLGKIFYL